MPVELRPHQKKAVRELGNGKILAGPVGSGKTLTALAYYVENESPKDIYVFTTARKRDELDWQKEAVKFGIGRERNGTTHGTITVDSWNNIKKYEGIENAWVVFDEQRLVGTGAWVRAFYKIAKRNRWVLLSGTPGDSWLDYIPVFVANGFYRNRTEFVDEHVVFEPFVKFPKVKRFLGKDRLENHRKRIIVSMEFDSHTVRHERRVTVDHNRDEENQILKQRWNRWEDRPIRDAAELFRLLRRSVNQDGDRLRQVIELQKKHPKLIVFYNFDYELEALRMLHEILWIDVAEWNGHKHEPIPESDEWLYLVQYTAGAEAWNCIETDAMIFYSLNYSYKIFEQAQGRIDRMNTAFTDLYYYIFVSDSRIDKAIWRSIQSKKNFSEAIFGREMGVV